MKNIITSSVILASAMALSACQSMSTDTSHSSATSSQPVLKSKISTVGEKPIELGTMYLRPVKTGTQVYGKLGGLTPGATVALHIHETGSCKNMGKAAGGHFNPTNKPHGNPESAESHAGDLPNITADTNGVASMNFVKQGITLDMAGPKSVYRHAFIVHANADDYTSQPSGDAGTRIACGIIEKV